MNLNGTNERAMNPITKETTVCGAAVAPRLSTLKLVSTKCFV